MDVQMPLLDGLETTRRLRRLAPRLPVIGVTAHALPEEHARCIEAGMVGVNGGCGGADGSPWVGMKESGYGFHSGPEGHRQFAQVRVISRPRAAPATA